MALIVFILIIWVIVYVIRESEYRKLESDVLKELGFFSWNVVSYFDEHVRVKSRQTLDKYDDVKFFKENKEKFEEAERIIQKKTEVSNILKSFLEKNDYKKRMMYKRVENKIEVLLKNTESYRICVDYISSAGNHLGQKEICVNQYIINKFKNDPSILMGKGEYNKYLKEQKKKH